MKLSVQARLWLLHPFSRSAFKRLKIICLIQDGARGGWACCSGIGCGLFSLPISPHRLWPGVRGKAWQTSSALPFYWRLLCCCLARHCNETLQHMAPVTLPHYNTPHSLNTAVSEGHKHRTCMAHLSLRTAPSAPGGAMDSWKGVLK